MSALAGDGLIGDGFPEVWNGLVFNTGGTSLAGPLWAGMWARVNAAAPRDADQVPSAGFAAPLIYRTAQTTPGAFYDVTVGDNQPYPALPGYDNATGWGPPNLTALMADVDHRTTPTDPEPTAPPAPPFVACGGGPLFVNPAHIAAVPEAGGRSVPAPQLSIVSGRMHGDGVTLSTTLTLTRLSSAVPAGAAEEDYEFSFFVGTHTYFTRAVVTALGTVSYFAGSVEEAPVGPERVPTDEVSGSFTPGADGTVTVRAPIRDFPGAAPGATLIAPSATTAVRPSTTGGVSLVVDTGGPGCDYRLGAVNAKVR